MKTLAASSHTNTNSPPPRDGPFYQPSILLESRKSFGSMTTSRIVSPQNTLAVQSSAVQREVASRFFSDRSAPSKPHEYHSTSCSRSLVTESGGPPQVPNLVSQKQAPASRYSSPVAMGFNRCTSAPCRSATDALPTNSRFCPSTRARNGEAHSTVTSIVSESSASRQGANRTSEMQGCSSTYTASHDSPARRRYGGDAVRASIINGGAATESDACDTAAAAGHTESESSAASKSSQDELDADPERSKLSYSPKLSSRCGHPSATNGITDLMSTDDEYSSPEPSRLLTNKQSQPVMYGVIKTCAAAANNATAAAVPLTDPASRSLYRMPFVVCAAGSCNQEERGSVAERQEGTATRQTAGNVVASPPFSPIPEGIASRFKGQDIPSNHSSSRRIVLSPMPSTGDSRESRRRRLQAPHPSSPTRCDGYAATIPTTHLSVHQPASPLMDRFVGGHQRSNSRHSTPARKSMGSLSDRCYTSSRAFLQLLVQKWSSRCEENKCAYREGGYLTVTPGRLLHNRYVAIHKLGWGEFSTVWLAFDTQHSVHTPSRDNRRAAPAFVAIKIAKCHSAVRASTAYEINLLHFMGALTSPSSPMTGLLDTFQVTGPYGHHLCMVMTVHGSNLLAVIDHMNGHRRIRTSDERRLVKEALVSTLLALRDLHAINVIHTDIKPENVLSTSPDPKVKQLMQAFCQKSAHRASMVSPEYYYGDGRDESSGTGREARHLVCLADFGLSVVLEPPSAAYAYRLPRKANADIHSGDRVAVATAVQPLVARLVGCKAEFPVVESGKVRNMRGTLIQTREYRSPEVLLGMDIACGSDIWSVGCMAYELITGEFLMDPKKKTTDERQMDLEHMAMIRQLIGPFPPELVEHRTRNNAYYSERARVGAAAASRLLPPHSERPPAYIHRFIGARGEFTQEERYSHYARRCLHAELAPYLGVVEAKQAASFILMCLYSYDPQHRPTAAKMLDHPWLREVL